MSKVFQNKGKNKMFEKAISSGAKKALELLKNKQIMLSDCRKIINIICAIVFIIVPITTHKVIAQSADDRNESDVPAVVSSYATPATFCPPGYDFFRPLGVPRCCPVGSAPRMAALDYTCYDSSGNTYRHTKSRGFSVVAGTPLSRRICREGQYLVERGGITYNYCIPPGEKVGLGTRANDYFLGCSPNTPLFTVDEHAPGSDIATSVVGQLQLPRFCEGGYGIFATQEEYKAGVCVCADGAKLTQADLAGQSCQERCGGNILFDSAEESLNACDLDPECAACRDEGYTYTALGCIDTSRSGLITWLIRLSIIVVMVAIIFRFVQASLLIRSGDPEKIKEGQEIITSAVIALVLVLISVPLLDFIGVKVLNIFPAGFITTGN